MDCDGADFMHLIRSTSTDQDEILLAIEKLYTNSGFQCDISYGNGSFYKNVKAPHFRFDIDPQQQGVSKASSENLPIPDNYFQNVVFDPPFLTYVRAAREGNGKMVMANRFGGYWTYSELTNHYQNTLKECARILQKKGVLIFKCQDIIHNHKMHCTHLNVVKWAESYGFELCDLFVLVANKRMPSPNREGTQKHARIFHSYFLVLRKCI